MGPWSHASVAMRNDRIRWLTDVVTTRPWVVVVVMLVLTAGMVVGAGQLTLDEQATEDDIVVDTAPGDALTYIEERYGTDMSDGATAVVYVAQPDGDVLTKQGLLTTLEYQATVLDDPTVAEELTADGVSSIASLVAAELAPAGTSPSLPEQRDILEDATPAEIETALSTVTTTDERTLALLPADVEAGTSEAESHRVLFHFTEDEDGAPPAEPSEVLFEAASAFDDPSVFTLGEHAIADATEQMNTNTMWLVVPFAIVLVLGVLAFTYRDLIDVVVGLTGVIVSIIWMFGLMGFLGIPAGMAAIVGPVLIAGLSIDFGFQVFNRYREERKVDEDIPAPMRRGLGSVGIALVLVTITAAIGFLANLINPVSTIRDLGIAITLGVMAALVVFLTLVPALKVGIDSLLERFGVNRQKRALGRGRYLSRLLGGGATLARRAAPVVIVGMLVLGLVGGVAWTALDEEPFQDQAEPAADWKADLPGPMAWEDPELIHNQRFVGETFMTVPDGPDDRYQLLIEGDVTDDGVLEAVTEATDREVFTAPGTDLVTPVTVIDEVVAEDADFAETVATADTTGDGIPDRNVDEVFDHLFQVAPDRAAEVIERSDGAYVSLRVIGPADGAGHVDDRAEDIESAAAFITSSGELEATAVSESIMMETQLTKITDGIVQVMLLALAAITISLAAISRWLHGSALVGLATAIPIGLVVGLVVGGMYLLSVPLTLVTALLMSLVIGLGIDYNIHITDRVMHELDRGRDLSRAIRQAVTGTGGALFGSALTSGAAFLALLVHPHPQIESFGILVVLGLTAAFITSVVVLPSLLATWYRYGRNIGGVDRTTRHDRDTVIGDD